MIKDFTLIWSFRNRYELLERSILTAHQTCPKWVNFCLVDADSSEDTIKSLRTFLNTLEGRKIRVCESSYRSSLAEAWNLGMMLASTRYVIFASSDIEFLKEEWFSELYSNIGEGMEYVMLENHSVFALDKNVIPKMGWFDEGFKIGPHFDTDFMVRGSEHGIKMRVLYPQEVLYSHNASDDESTKSHQDIDVKERQKMDLPDRLPMNDPFNENYFKEKWMSQWNGWSEGVHPPNHINQAKRMLKEKDPHPLYTKKYIY